MNSIFLSRVFNNHNFVEDYRCFLGSLQVDAEQFRTLAWRDNYRKITSYVPVIEECIRERTLKVIKQIM